MISTIKYTRMLVCTRMSFSLSKACRNESVDERMNGKQRQVFCYVNLLHHIILLRYVRLCKALILDSLTKFYSSEYSIYKAKTKVKMLKSNNTILSV